MSNAEAAAPPMEVDQLLELSGVGVALLDSEGVIERANATFARMLAGTDAIEGESARSRFIQPAFRDLVKSSGSGEHWHLVHEDVFNLGWPDAIARSVRGRAWASRAGILVVLEEDVSSYESLVQEVLALNNDLAQLHREQARNVAQLRRTEQELRDALGQVRALRGLLPICAHCKRIRRDEGTWEQLESYIARHSEVEFSHGICQRCMTEQLRALDG